MKQIISVILCGISSTFVIGTGLLFSGAVVATPPGGTSSLPLNFSHIDSSQQEFSKMDSSQMDLAACRVLGHEELAARRGGFEFAGLTFEFGANIRSYFDNRLVLESLVSITREGMTQQKVLSQSPTVAVEGVSSASKVLQLLTQRPDAPVQSSVEEVSASAGKVPVSLTEVPVKVPEEAGVSQRVDVPVLHDSAVTQSNAIAAEVPATVDLSGLRDAVGVRLNDRKGFTAALHQVNRERIASLIVNTASGRKIRQELDVRVDVANFRQFQRSARQAILNSRFGAAALK
jgi:hypothetical protein